MGVNTLLLLAVIILSRSFQLGNHSEDSIPCMWDDFHADHMLPCLFKSSMKLQSNLRCLYHSQLQNTRVSGEGPQTTAHRDVHWAHADKFFQSWSLGKITSTCLGKTSPCFHRGSGRPVRRQSFKFRSLTGLFISHDFVGSGTVAVLFHGPYFKFKTKRQSNGVR